MKVIDLLNKIAKGEEVPKEIVYNTRIFRYNEYNKCYIWNCDGDEFYLSTYYRLESILNDEIEILEEEKEIEEFKLQCTIANHYSKENIQCLANEMVRKMNKLREELNNLKKEGK